LQKHSGLVHLFGIYWIHEDIAFPLSFLRWNVSPNNPNSHFPKLWRKSPRNLGKTLCTCYSLLRHVTSLVSSALLSTAQNCLETPCFLPLTSTLFTTNKPLFAKQFNHRTSWSTLKVLLYHLYTTAVTGEMAQW